MQILLFLLHFIIPNNYSQPASCLEEHNYYVQGKRKISTVGKGKQPALQIFLLKNRPPVGWWSRKINPIKTYIYDNQLLVRVINDTGNPVEFLMPDSQLMLCLQAKNKEGNWVDVEIPFKGICGNSIRHGRCTMNANCEWLTFTQLPEGDFRTTYRLKLQLDLNTDVPVRYIFSNEIAGSIDSCKL